MRAGHFLRVLFIGLLAGLTACVGSNNGNAPIPFGAKVTHRAVLIGKSNHDMVGTLSLYQSDEPAVLVFEPNFRAQSLPSSPTVLAFGMNGYRADTVFATLDRSSGRQSYAVPTKIGLDTVNEVWLWSPSNDLPVGLARLTPI